MAKPKKVIRTKSIYKKRSRFPTWLKTILFALFVVFFVGFGFLVAKELNKYFAKKEQEQNDNQSLSSESSDSTTPSQEEVSSEQQFKDNFKTAIMPMNILKNPQLQDEYLLGVKEKGFNSILIELKTSEGLIHFKSTNELAASYNAIAPDAVDIAPVIDKITQSGLTPVAQIYTLMDKTAPHTSRKNSYGYGSNTNVNWYDNSPQNGGKPWLNPFMENTQNYISQIVGELSSAGFKQVNLKGLYFPHKNTSNMNTINENISKAQALVQIIEKSKQAANGVPVVNVVDATAYVGIENNGYFGQLQDVNCDYTALYINVELITANKDSICETLAISKDSNITEVVSKLVAKCKQNDNTSIIIPNIDGIQQIMSENGINSCTIY